MLDNTVKHLIKVSGTRNFHVVPCR